MKIIWNEMKKIWNLKNIIMIILLSTMCYIVFLQFHIKHYPNGHPQAETLALSTMLTEKYGSTIEPDEFNEFLQMREELVKAADQAIVENSDLAKREIKNYAELQEYENRLSDENATWEDREELQKIMNEFYNLPADTGSGVTEFYSDSEKKKYGSDTPKLAYMLPAFDNIVEKYENGATHLLQSEAPAIYHKRWNDMINTGEWRSPICWEVIENTTQYAQNLVALLMLLSLLCFAPLLTSDRVRKIHLLQYTAKQGRKIIGKQLLAVLISSILLTTTLFLVFGGIYAQNDTQLFWNNYVSSFNGMMTSIPLTFGQYVIVICIMMYLMGIAVSVVAFLLSRFAANYIVLLAGLIPTFVVSVMLCDKLFFNPLNGFKNGIALFDPMVCGIILLVVVVVGVGVLVRERRIDILV
ncbi:hypothetical protein FACS1894111_09120 [Clostridia bacterium]|nr:hypothetical protein FACS1894111_09120 [Clostridia bacterium]